MGRGSGGAGRRASRGGGLSQAAREEVLSILAVFDAMSRARAVPFSDIKKGDFVLGAGGIPRQVTRVYANGDLALANGDRERDYGPLVRIQRVSPAQAQTFEANQGLFRAYMLTPKSKSEFVADLRVKRG